MNYRSLLLILAVFITPNYTCTKGVTNDLFKAIELADYAAFNEAIAEGANINGINPNNGNTPLIESLCALVKTIESVDNRRQGIIAASLVVGAASVMGLDAVATAYNNSWMSHIAAWTAGIASGLISHELFSAFFVRHKEMNIPALIHITHTLMKHPYVDIDKANQNTATSARDIINSVLNATITTHTYYTTQHYPSYCHHTCHGYFHSCCWSPGFTTVTPHTYTVASFVVNGTTHRINESLYHAQIKPIFKNIQKLIR